MLSQRPLISKPAGSENFDREALSEQQQITTNKTKVIILNLKYLIETF